MQRFFSLGLYLLAGCVQQMSFAPRCGTHRLILGRKRYWCYKVVASPIALVVLGSLQRGCDNTFLHMLSSILFCVLLRNQHNISALRLSADTPFYIFRMFS